MCVDAKNIVHASINEKGKTTGGKTGDQTGKEICTRSFYTYKGGWDYHFRYEEQSTSQQSTSHSTSKGNDLIALGQQHTINYTGVKIDTDGIYGPKTKANIIMDSILKVLMLNLETILKLPLKHSKNQKA